MAKCGLCGGTGQVASSGISGELTGVFGPSIGQGVRECGRCHGSGEVNDDGGGRYVPPPSVPSSRQEPARYQATPAAGPPTTLTAERTAARQEVTDLSNALPGTWMVEFCGFGRVLAVMRLSLTRKWGHRRFEARPDYGGLPGWRAKGDWIVLPPGNEVRLSGTQSCPGWPIGQYRWGATLAAAGEDVLQGSSMVGESLTWRRAAS